MSSPASSNKICSQNPPLPAQRRPRGCVSITGALPGLPAGPCAAAGISHGIYFQVSALPRSQPPALSPAGWHRNPSLSQQGLSGCCPPAWGLAGPRGQRGMPRAPQPPAPSGLPGHHPSIWGSSVQDAPAQEWAWAQGTVGWAGWRLACHHPPPPIQIPQDTRLVAEIPFISLNCITSNTAGGRISVDLSYWGWRVQNLAEKIYHARKIIAVVSAIYRREGQQRSAPSLPASGHRGTAPASRGKPGAVPAWPGRCSSPLWGADVWSPCHGSKRTMTGTSPLNP